MARTVDITDKLNFEEKPELVIKGEKIKVNNDARSMLELLGVINGGEASETEILEKGIPALFDKKEQEKLYDLNLSIKDFTTVISAAMELATNTGDDAGEEVSHTTT